MTKANQRIDIKGISQDAESVLDVEILRLDRLIEQNRKNAASYKRMITTADDAESVAHFQSQIDCHTLKAEELKNKRNDTAFLKMRSIHHNTPKAKRNRRFLAETDVPTLYIRMNQS